MGTRIVNIDPTRATREIADTGQVVAWGEEVEVEDSALAESLLEQENVWARPQAKAAKEAERAARRLPREDTPPVTTPADKEA